MVVLEEALQIHSSLLPSPKDPRNRQATAAANLQDGNNKDLGHPLQPSNLRMVVVVVFSVATGYVVCDEYFHDVLESNMHYRRRNIQDKGVSSESSQPFWKKRKTV